MTARLLEAKVRELCDEPWVGDVVAFVDAEMERDGGHDEGHLLRVLRNARAIVAGERERVASEAGGTRVEVSWPAIVAAVLMHDLVNLPKDHPERHLASTQSAERAVTFLARSSSFPWTELDRVGEAIRCHSFSAGLPAESLEAQIVSDADRLEVIGAIAIARTFYVSGRMGRAIADFEDPFATERALDDLAYAVDHFYTKLLKLKERLYTPTARALASPRHAFMQAFLDQLAIEL